MLRAPSMTLTVLFLVLGQADQGWAPLPAQQAVSAPAEWVQPFPQATLSAAPMPVQDAPARYVAAVQLITDRQYAEAVAALNELSWAAAGLSCRAYWQSASAAA